MAVIIRYGRFFCHHVKCRIENNEGAQYDMTTSKITIMEV